MKRFFTTLLLVLVLAVLLTLTASAEDGTATFYNGNNLHVTLELEGNTLTLPAAPTTAANTRFVGWALEVGESEILYTSGTSVTLPDGMTAPVFRAVSVEFKTLTGAAVSVSSPTTLRFDGAIGKGDYDRLVSLVGTQNVQLGMLLAPADSVRGAETDGSKFNLTCGAEGLLDRPTSSFFYSTDRYHVFSGRTDAIADTQLLTMYAARCYLTVFTESGPVTVYTAFVAENHTRMAHYVTAMAYEDRTEIPAGSASYTQATNAIFSPYSAAVLSRLEDRLDHIISISQWNSVTQSTEVRIASEYAKTPFGPFTDFVYYTSPYTVARVLEDEPAGYDTYVIVANEGADIDRVTAYYIGKSIRPPKAEEWRDDGIYISVRNVTS